MVAEVLAMPEGGLSLWWGSQQGPPNTAMLLPVHQ